MKPPKTLQAAAGAVFSLPTGIAEAGDQRPEILRPHPARAGR